MQGDGEEKPHRGAPVGVAIGETSKVLSGLDIL